MCAVGNPEQKLLKEVLSLPVKVKGMIQVLLLESKGLSSLIERRWIKISLQRNCCWGTWGQLSRSNIAFELREGDDVLLHQKADKIFSAVYFSLPLLAHCCLHLVQGNKLQSKYGLDLKLDHACIS